jgi:branched-chain amino acid transport system permease protein
MGGVVGVAVGGVMTTWFAEATATTKAAVAAAMLVGLAAVGLRITGGQHPHDFPELFRGSAFRLAGVEVTNTSVATLALAVIFTISATLFLNRSHVGLQLRALARMRT